MSEKTRNHVFLLGLVLMQLAFKKQVKHIKQKFHRAPLPSSVAF